VRDAKKSYPLRNVRLGYFRIVISPAHAALMQEGVSILVGTADAARVPNVVRAHGAFVTDAEHDLITLYVPEATGQEAFANLRAVPKIAVTFGRPRDYVALQAKGDCVALRPGNAVDRELIRRYIEAFIEANRPFGIEPQLRHWVSWPAIAIEVRVTAIFKQTPGPGAGERA
jgi:hypothetical protein